ncbi:MAG: RluA family pseudouridine synthase [Candidatus Marinimicrobia bacterium]|nr:RluA family pseudouridine synthase [Candidatus Neomarinimicrobiota bacterium]MDP7094837.1 RluA family pseudouridine synthase [Candidatus Neomarinimicrobiota bacterium]
MITNNRVITGEENTRLDHYLVEQLPEVTRTLIQKMIKQEFVTVNGKLEKANYRLQVGDTVIAKPMDIEPEIDSIIPEDIPLNILFEDDDIIIINKQAGLVVHPGKGNYTGTLVHGLKHHCENLSTLNEALRPGIVHRLDQETSGIMVVAKTNNAHSNIAAQFQDRTVEKTYMGISWGIWKEKEGCIDVSLKRNRKNPTTFCVDESGRKAVTYFKVLQDFRYMSVVEFYPKTGRTHQIRIHAMHMNHSIVHDEKYNGGVNRTKGFLPEVQRDIKLLLKKMNRHALHAKQLSFNHPISGERVNFTAELPQDMQTMIEHMQTHYG